MANKKAVDKAVAGRRSGGDEDSSRSRRADVRAPDTGHEPELNEVDREVIGALTGFRDTLRARTPLETKYTVRQVVAIMPPPELGPDDVRRIREELTISQPVFADFLGTSTSTIRSWEQGQKTPSPMARRLLGLIAADPIYWKSRFSAMTVVRSGGKKVSGVTAGPTGAPDDRASTVVVRRRRPRT